MKIFDIIILKILKIFCCSEMRVWLMCCPQKCLVVANGTPEQVAARIEMENRKLCQISTRIGAHIKLTLSP